MTSLLNKLTTSAKEAVTLSLPFINGLCLLHITGNYVCSPVVVSRPRIQPPLKFTGNVLLMEHLSTSLGTVGPGDLVIARSPNNPNKMIANRITAVQGQTVTFRLNPNDENSASTILIPEGHVWLDSDEISKSPDSRQLGPIPRGLILGKVFCRVWPPHHIGRVK